MSAQMHESGVTQKLYTQRAQGAKKNGGVCSTVEFVVGGTLKHPPNVDRFHHFKKVNPIIALLYKLFGYH